MTTHTTLAELRRFLELSGGAPTPWSGPGAVTETLYERLAAKRDDPVFWSRLGQLVSRLERSRFDPRPLMGEGALPGPAVDRIVGELRDSLPRGRAARPKIGDWLRGRVSTPALCGFLLLGSAFAAACDDCEDKAQDDGMTASEAEVYCDLKSTLKDADCSSSEYQTLMDCLPDLDASEREQMLEMFQSESASSICSQIASMYWYGDCQLDCFFEDCH